MDRCVECTQESSLLFLLLQSLLNGNVCHVEHLTFFIVEDKVHAFDDDCAVFLLVRVASALVSSQSLRQHDVCFIA